MSNKIFFFGQQSVLGTTIPTPLHAWAMDRIVSGYVGNSVELREDGGDTLANIGFVGDVFDSAAAAAHIGGGNGFIRTWYDQAGSADLVQATNTLQPQLVSNKNRGDGTDDYMNVGTTSLAADLTVSFWMRSSTSNSTRSYPADFGNGGSGALGNNLTFDANDSSSGMFFYYCGGGSDNITSGSLGDYTDTNWQHFLVRRTGTAPNIDIQMLVNNVDAGTDTVGSQWTVNNEITLWAREISFLFPFAGDVDKVRIWDQYLTDDEATLVFNDSP